MFAMSYSRRRVADKQYEKLSNTALGLATVQREAFPKGRGGYFNGRTFKAEKVCAERRSGDMNPWDSLSMTASKPRNVSGRRILQKDCG
jgi:hypothetical protein